MGQTGVDTLNDNEVDQSTYDLLILRRGHKVDMVHIKIIGAACLVDMSQQVESFLDDDLSLVPVIVRIC